MKNGYYYNNKFEVEAREKVVKSMERTFERYRFKFSEDDKFNLFVSIITNAMDPHTEFFPPVDKRYFDEQMSGRFFGIGASLIYDEGNIKINTLIAGSPAWKSGKIQINDEIVKVLADVFGIQVWRNKVEGKGVNAASMGAAIKARMAFLKQETKSANNLNYNEIEENYFVVEPNFENTKIYDSMIENYQKLEFKILYAFQYRYLHV